MADVSYVGDVLSSGEPSADRVDSEFEKRPLVADDSCQFACVLCCTTAAAASAHRRLKMLPCLHVTCQPCLVQFLLNKSSTYKDTNCAAAIFTCPCCSYAIQLPADGVDGLKDASFLQTANSSAVIPDDASVVQLNDNKSCKQTSTPLLSLAVNCGAGDGHANGTALLSGNFSQSLLETDTERLQKYVGSSKHCTEMLHVSSEDIEERSNCGDSDLTSLDDTVGLMRSQISRLSLDASVRQQDCQQTLQHVKLAAHDLDARKAELRQTISQRADYLCQLICSRRDQLLNEVEREHSQSYEVYSDRMNAVAAYSRSLEDSCLFASAVLAANDVSAEVEVDVVARLNQLILCDMPGVQGPSDMPQIAAMRLDVPDSQHEEAFMEKLFGSVVSGTVGTIEFLNSFNTELQWPTGFVMTHSHDSVLVGKAGAFAEEGAVMFYDSHGTCVHRHSLPAGHLPVDVIAVGGGDILVSDVSGRVTKFSLSGRLTEEWSDVFQGPSGHMAVNGRGEILITSAGECCIHQYRDSERLTSFSLQWPDDCLSAVPDITAITVNSHNEIIITASNFHNPYFFSAGGQFLHSSLTEIVDEGVGASMQNGVKSTAVALPSAVCCDSFDNVLIADFIGNSIHLVSRSGLHLGCLLTKTHGIACPNFVALDQDGRLYVGQYGGDVLVFRYLSYVKHV